MSGAQETEAARTETDWGAYWLGFLVGAIWGVGFTIIGLVVLAILVG